MFEEPIPFLSTDEAATLLRIARDAVVAGVRGEDVVLGHYPLTPRLQEKHGAFVTLRCHGELRGCIGYTRGIKSLAETVCDNAMNAALRDPRFPPLTVDELPHVSIEISALCPGLTADSPFIPVNDISEIVLGRDGLFLERAGPRGGGLLLPHVAIEQGWNLHQFLAGVCRKAGALDDAWRQPGIQLYRFSAHVFSERS
ncbi:MAG: AmmeMemoRadiSam system protein A [Candidatus Hydrogenedentes bacterium]|nr:AmmeMemoRadiSam system protein A [Candidatus Hydrogenedentota bacterium]